MADSFFFIDDELDWWGDVERGAGAAPAVAVPGPLPRRQPPRTLARDLARLREEVERRSPVPAAAAGLAALVLLVALVTVVRLSLTGEEAREPPLIPLAQAPASQAASAEGAPAAAAAPEPGALESGSRGARVSDLQVALTALGLVSGVDGSFGPATAGAVAGFQGANGLVADGVVGSLTTAALQQALWERASADAGTAEAGLAAAVDAGRLSPAAAKKARAALAATLVAIRSRSPGRGAVLGLALHDVAAVAEGYSAAGTPALFDQLRANVQALAAGLPTIDARAVADGTGVVYRWFPDHGYQFHPLANFAKLNGLVRSGRRAEAERLASALVARGVRSGKGLLWEYRFPFGGPAVWTSGFAQAAGAQALARTGTLLNDRTLLDAAAAAFRAIPRDLTLSVEGGSWIQEYSFSGMPVLNAQLQSIVSLTEYAETTGNKEAAAYIDRLSDTTRSLIGRLDTGCWSRYALNGDPATVSYHTYHVKLLETLARTGDPVWTETAARWRGYLDNGGC